MANLGPLFASLRGVKYKLPPYSVCVKRHARAPLHGSVTVQVLLCKFEILAYCRMGVLGVLVT